MVCLIFNMYVDHIGLAAAAVGPQQVRPADSRGASRARPPSGERCTRRTLS